MFDYYLLDFFVIFRYNLLKYKLLFKGEKGIYNWKIKFNICLYRVFFVR